jgi:hypothetical protein
MKWERIAGACVFLRPVNRFLLASGLRATLLLVWQQNGSTNLARGSALAPGFLGDALGSPGGHTFALKLSGWFPAG